MSEDKISYLSNKRREKEQKILDNLGFEDLKPKEIALVEALIFSSKKKLPRTVIKEITAFSEEKLERIIIYLEQKYQGLEFGIQLKEYNDSYLFQTKKEFAAEIEQLFDITKVSSLSTASMETLAIIAYRQPVTRSEIEEIRGVSVERTLTTLTKYDLIEEVGRKETIGNPIIYGTTDQFLEYLDIEDLAELPEIERVEKLFAEEIEAAAEEAAEEEMEAESDKNSK
ncbi:segregation and condensation protein B [Halanaerobium saccharolyticum]|uniref:Segregation and condensation protein B n=1 Tax=Halanaerobium saccharolyticum TaxID=43595 RepID=A0A4R7Z7T9_9FIRM|nr:SMC-Scp complex subunit ScpB [Halanaerobium saccharolyticum]RAK11078.1 segregation and condensation protein B [Halanaerobium saccharolyticum]TDW06929.1 segregation and condensation protein B [Halanaerobium saccharolyticum]TDX63694.1 segregation and condensation protein B [Halanaerobium saccharolyticum]